MKESEMVLTIIRGVIVGMDTLDQARLAEVAAKLRMVVLEAGDVGPMALVLVTAEVAVEAEE